MGGGSWLDFLTVSYGSLELPDWSITTICCQVVAKENEFARLSSF
jgi:hypothetical protein